MVTFYKPVKKETVKKAVKVECSDLDLQAVGDLQQGVLSCHDGDNLGHGVLACYFSLSG